MLYEAHFSLFLLFYTQHVSNKKKIFFAKIGFLICVIRANVVIEIVILCYYRFDRKETQTDLNSLFSGYLIIINRYIVGKFQCWVTNTALPGKSGAVVKLKLPYYANSADYNQTLCSH